MDNKQLTQSEKMEVDQGSQATTQKGSKFLKFNI